VGAITCVVESHVVTLISCAFMVRLDPEIITC
jgi:hypothetical protein